MRIVTALTLALVATTTATAGAAPARGVTYTDAAGDANALDGANGAGSQPSLDIRKVTLSPHLATRTTSGVTVRVELAAAPSTTPGTSYTFSAKQYGCATTATHTVGVEGAVHSVTMTCGTSGGYHSALAHPGLGVKGTSITFVVPEAALFDAHRGAGLTDVVVSTTFGEPATGASAPAAVDRAAYSKVYRVGS